MRGAGGPTPAELWLDGSDVDHVMADKLAPRGYVAYDVRTNTVRVRNVEISTVQKGKIVGVVPVPPRQVEVEGRLTQVVGLLVRSDGSAAPLFDDTATV